MTASSPFNPLVSLHNLRVSLGGTAILDGVDAQLARGKVTALIGLNGSGKTTLLRAILKEIPYTGKIQFHCGHDHNQPMPQHVGYVPQRLQFDANMPLTVQDLLALALQRRPLFLGIRSRFKKQMVEMMAMVGSPASLLEKPVEKISGGEFQRVLLSLALAPCPELLLLDEPAAGVDFKDQEPFYDLIHRLNRDRGVTILLVSHELSIVNKHADHVLCLNEGRIQCQGPPHEMADMLTKIFGDHSGVFAHYHDHQ